MLNTRSADIPNYSGLEWIHAELPQEREAWPKFANRILVDASGDDYDLTREELVHYSKGKPWIWPGDTIYFFCDLHADADAFFVSLVASGGIEKTGPGDEDFDLTPEGRVAKFVIGGDCLDKGPDNLRLLSVLRSLIQKGARVELLAGNHDVRFLVGLFYAGSRDPRHAHLFVRMGKKAVPIFSEIWERYLKGKVDESKLLPDEEVKRRLWPGDEWFDSFPDAVRDTVTETKIRKEVRRIREKCVELSAHLAARDMTLGMLWAAQEKAKELFCSPEGDFGWYFDGMQLAYRAGSFLFVHAGIDDLIARVLRRGGVQGLNSEFRRLVDEDLFALYHGPVGNAFRTKYRNFDLPLTARGVRDLHRSGIYAVVHGHRNIVRGQRIRMREGLLNFECDASVDRNTRIVEGLSGIGGAVTIVRPDGSLLGISTDYKYVKVLDAAAVLEMTAIVGADQQT
ncbi:MAG: metallophosphoesterase [Planctomycetes bacterium]|nr:metallophosphoesterase [Planctomycetota bacterium]